MSIRTAKVSDLLTYTELKELTKKLESHQLYILEKDFIHLEIIEITWLTKHYVFSTSTMSGLVELLTDRYVKHKNGETF
jgi:hypothetical protein